MSRQSWIRGNTLLADVPISVLDPLLARLSKESMPKSVHLALNYSSILYLLESLNTLLRFGGQGLSKACHTTELAQSSHQSISGELPGVVDRVRLYFESAVDTLLALPGATYLDQMMNQLIE